MKKFSVIVPPSTFLLSDRVFPSLGPIQIATVARDVAEWRVEVIDLTGHAKRCTSSHSGVNTEAARGTLVGAVSSQAVVNFEHDGEACEVEIWAYARKRIAESAADVYGIHALSCHAAYTVRLLKIIHEERPKGTRAIVGGPHASLVPDEFSQAGFDGVIVAQTGGGGGETGTLAALRDYLINGDLEGGKHYASSGQNGHHWSWPDRRLFDWKSYKYKLRGEPCATIVTQHGCPWSCSFCSHGPGYTQLRYRNIDHVRAELRELRNRFGYRAVMCYDDEVNIDGRKPNGHFVQLCKALRDEGFIWRAFIKSNVFDENQARLAAECGAVQLCTGVESADPAIKKAIRKGSTVEDDERFVDLCLKYGIAAKVFSMVGLPGETPRTTQALLDFHLRQVAKDAKLYDFDVTVYTPYPGTPLFDNPEAHGLRVVKPLEYMRDTVIYKGKPGEYASYTETFDPKTGKTLLSAAEIVVWRDRIETEVRRAAGQTHLRRDAGT